MRAGSGGRQGSVVLGQRVYGQGRTGVNLPGLAIDVR